MGTLTRKKLYFERTYIFLEKIYSLMHKKEEECQVKIGNKS